jgi:uncharacterized protein YegL
MRKLPVYFLIDTSGSMRNDKIKSVNQGIVAVSNYLFSNPMALETVHMGLISFDDQAKVVVPLTEILSFTPPALTVDQGLTSLGAALSLLAQQIKKDVVRQTQFQKGDWTPLVFILTDGEPTDDWEKGLKDLKTQSAEIIACAIGADCDTYVLKQITTNVVEMPNFSEALFKDFFKWVSLSIDHSSKQIQETTPLDLLPNTLSLLKGEGKKITPPQDSIYNEQRIQKAINKDKYGNPNGPEFDLAKDNAFKDVLIAVLHLYTGEGFDFSLPTGALKQKGFTIKRWANHIPTLEEFKTTLSKSSQLWIISDQNSRIPESHLKEIEKYFHEGKGVYIWGDNDPYYYDANIISKRLLSVELYGDDMGDQVIHLNSQRTRGISQKHPVNVGIEFLYEGITISSIPRNVEYLSPILHSSNDKLVIASYEQDGKRLIIDGGFTRLYCNWDTAGTARYVKNAASWLVNYERFGQSIFTRNR